MFDQARQLGKWVAEAGADALHVSAGHYRSRPNAQIMIPPMAFPEGVFLDYAARIKHEVKIPVIAVGRLGNPQVAMRAIADGVCDFVAIGRGMIADPDWAEKARGGQAIRRCLSCNTCVDEMRAGARLGCLVNPMAARESEFVAASPIAGERIAVIGAGPAGLSYAAAVGVANAVTVFERAAHPGGALLLAGQAARFQEVAARAAPFYAYVAELERAAREAGVVVRYEIDVLRQPHFLLPFDRIVVATGASYRFGLRWIVPPMLRAGLGRSRLMAWLFTKPAARAWFYTRARKPTGAAIAALAKPTQKVVVIGDARLPGKAKDAIREAVEAAYRK